MNKDFTYKGGWGNIKVNAPSKEIANEIVKKLTIIPIKQLLELGFNEVEPRRKEEEFCFDWHRLTKNDCELDVTTEYDLSGKPLLQYIELNTEKLNGDPIGVDELKFLITLL